jgi:hypothetical protein
MQEAGSFCEQKKPKKLSLPLLPLARVPPQTQAKGNKVGSFFASLLSNKEDPSLA